MTKVEFEKKQVSFINELLIDQELPYWKNEHPDSFLSFLFAILQQVNRRIQIGGGVEW